MFSTGTVAALIASALLVPFAALGADRDGDGIEDEADAFPDNVTIAVASLTGSRVIRGDHFGTIREDIRAGFHFFEARRFAICEATCLFGDVEKTHKNRKFRLKLDREARKSLAEQVEFAIEDELTVARGAVHDIDFSFDGSRQMKTWMSKKKDRLAVKLFYEFDAKIRQPKPKKDADGKTRIEASGPFSGFADRD